MAHRYAVKVREERHRRQRAERSRLFLDHPLSCVLRYGSFRITKDRQGNDRIEHDGHDIVDLLRAVPLPERFEDRAAVYRYLRAWDRVIDEGRV